MYLNISASSNSQAMAASEKDIEAGIDTKDATEPTSNESLSERRRDGSAELRRKEEDGGLEEKSSRKSTKDVDDSTDAPDDIVAEEQEVSLPFKPQHHMPI